MAYSEIHTLSSGMAGQTELRLVLSKATFVFWTCSDAEVNTSAMAALSKHIIPCVALPQAQHFVSLSWDLAAKGYADLPASCKSETQHQYVMQFVVNAHMQSIERVVVHCAVSYY